MVSTTNTSRAGTPGYTSVDDLRPARRKRRAPGKAHISQVRSARYNPTGRRAGSLDCGPASVVMAVRLLGRDIPGFHGERRQSVIDAARRLATGRVRHEGTNGPDLERALGRAGVGWDDLGGTLRSVLAPVDRGLPVILYGAAPDDANDFDGRWRYKPSTPTYNHWVVVSRHKQHASDGREYVVNDPMSTVGPTRMSKRQLHAYVRHASGEAFGIAVGLPPRKLGSKQHS